MPRLPPDVPRPRRHPGDARRQGPPLGGGRGIDAPRVLLIRFSSLGDVILATAAASALKRSVPRAHITFLTKGGYLPLLEGHRDLDRVVTCSPSAGPGELWRLCRRLGPMDAVVDLHGSLRSLLCRRFVDAGARATWSRETVRRRLWTRGLLRGSMDARARHVVDRYLDGLRDLGIPVEPVEPRIDLKPGDLEEARSFLGDRGVTAPGATAVLVPGARWPNKRWGGAGFAEVGRWLARERGLQPVIAGDTADLQVSRETARSLRDEGAVDITAATGLRLLAAVLADAELVVGNDSGPGHLAAAVGTPVVTLFGPTVEAFGFTPLGARVRTVSLPLTCRPCSLHGGETCPRGERRCLDDIGPDRVIHAVREVLGHP